MHTRKSVLVPALVTLFSFVFALAALAQEKAPADAEKAPPKAQEQQKKVEPSPAQVPEEQLKPQAPEKKEAEAKEPEKKEAAAKEGEGEQKEAAAEPEKKEPSTPADFIELGDKMWANRGLSRKKAEEALDMYQKALKMDSGNYEALWRIARACWWISDGSSNQKFKEKWGGRGHDMAQKAINANPNGFDGYYWAAATIGEWSKGIGILKALTKGVSGKMTGYLDKAMAISDTKNSAGVHRIYGRYWYKLPWPKYDGEKALKHLSTAVAKFPNKTRNLVYYAQALKEEDKDAEAMKQLDAAINNNCSKDDDPADCLRQKKVAKEIKKKWSE